MNIEDFYVHRPITRSISHTRDKLVSEQGVMGDLNSIQKQLEAFMAMYKEDKAMMALRFEELTLQVTQSQKGPKEEQFGETSRWLARITGARGVPS